jgi:hypothetical protein
MENRALKQTALAMIAAIIAAPALADAPASGWLTANEIRYVFIGREVKGEYANREPFTETYRLKGKVEYTDNSRTARGAWSFAGNTFCTQYEGMEGGCFKVRMHSDNCFEYWLVKDKGETDGAWIARSWRTRYPSTCQPQS